MNKKPNIVWIYCDELRSDAVGCCTKGTMRVRTPNIDAMAARGVTFTNCFCNSPICVSSRTSTLTGLYPEDNGCYSNEAAWRSYRLMVDDIVTFPEVFAAHGYKTADFGKLHVPRNVHPWQLQVSEGGLMKDLEDFMIKPLPNNELGGPFPTDQPYKPELVAENGIKWMAENGDPFLVRFSFLQPHTPLLPRPPYDTMYANIEFEDIPDECKRLSTTEKLWADAWKAGGFTAEKMRGARAFYCGLVGWVDEQVGRILDFLETTSRLEETIIVFGSDHGTAKGENGCGAKHTFAPHVHRVPLFLSWPSGGVPEGQIRDDLAQNMDVPRTLFGTAGIDPPTQFKGRNLLGDPEPQCIFSTIGFGFSDSRAAPRFDVGIYLDGKGWPRRTCLRTRRYRYEKNVRIDGRRTNPSEEDAFLADLDLDPFEVWNRVDEAEYASVVKELDGMLSAHAATANEVPWEFVKNPFVKNREIAR